MNEALADERSRRSAPSPCNGSAEREAIALPAPKEEFSTMIQDIENKHGKFYSVAKRYTHIQLVKTLVGRLES